MLLGPNFSSFDLQLSSGISIHGVQSSPKPAAYQPAVLLLHGYPQNHLIWHKVAPALSSSFRVVAIDLRGYGQSSKPRDAREKENNHKMYAKSTMAEDCVEVMEKLGETSFYLLSHDRGARVAHQLSINYPAKVKKVILMDICPTLAMYEATNMTFAKTYWHWFFMLQPSPFPESFYLANPSAFIKAAFGDISFGSDAGAFHKEAIASYEEMFHHEDAVHAMCEDYRAGASIDLDEQREDIKNGRKIKCDVRILWGSKGLVGKMFDPIEEWQKVTSGKVTGEAVECGHYIPEEAPETTIRHALDFFQDTP